MPASSPTSANSDPYVWIGASGSFWDGVGNWSDPVVGPGAAPDVPGVSTPVSVTASGTTTAVIAGSGGAASLSISGTVDLTGSIAVGGAVAIGGMAASQLILSSGGVIDAGSVAVEAGDFADAGGTVAISGALSLDNGGAVHVTAGGSFTVSGGVSSPDGFLITQGAGSKLVAMGGFEGISVSIVAYGGFIQMGDVVFDPVSVSNATLLNPSFFLGSSGTIEIGTAGAAAAGALTIDAGHSVTADQSTTVSGNLVNNGAIIANAGTFGVGDGSVTGNGVLQIGAGATLSLAGAVASTQTIAFVGMGAALSIGSSYAYNGNTSVPTPYAIAALLTGFQIGDRILLAQPVTTATYTAGTGGNPGTLVLSNGAGSLETLHLAGTFTGESFLVGPTTYQGASISLLPVQAGGGSAATGADAFSWITPNGGDWRTTANWSDTTASMSPATQVPGAASAVTIAGATDTTFTTISGNGVAASLSLAGDVSLGGTTTVGGAVTIGASAAPADLLLRSGSVLNAASILVNGTVSLDPGGRLSTTAALSLGDGSLADNDGTVVLGGALTIGAGALSVSASGRASIAGAITLAAGSISVAGSGSTLIATGSLQMGGHISATSNGTIQFGNVVLSPAAGSGQAVSPSINVDTSSSIEIGSGGGAGLGVISIDAGYSITANGSAGLSGVSDNGTIAINAGTLQVVGLSGNGVVQIAGNAELSLQLGAGGNGTIDFMGTGAILASRTTGKYGSAITSIGPTLAGFDTGDSIVLDTLADHATYTAGAAGSAGTLVVSNGTVAVQTITLAGDYTGRTFTVAPAAVFGQTSNNGVAISVSAVACFVTGTRIATSHGPVAVEALRIGDSIVTAGGACRPVIWIGHRHLNIAAHPDPELVLPVRIRANAVAPSVPARDLCVSPDHGLFFDGMLIAAHALVNGDTIVREQTAAITYWHVELDSHDILLAENMAAESYLDTGNRAGFDCDVSTLHPNFVGDADLYARYGAAPFVSDPALVRPIWDRLSKRGVGSSFVADIGALRLFAMAHGNAIAGRSDGGGRYVFALPAGVASVVLRSAAARPSDREPWCGDRRMLGLAIGGIAIDDRDVPLAGLGRGWHATEAHDGSVWRWTDGAAHIELPEPGTLLEIRVTSFLPWAQGFLLAA